MVFSVHPTGISDGKACTTIMFDSPSISFNPATLNPKTTHKEHKPSIDGGAMDKKRVSLPVSGSTSASEINHAWFTWLTTPSGLLLYLPHRASQNMLRPHTAQIVYVLYPPCYHPVLVSSLIPSLNSLKSSGPDGIHCCLLQMQAQTLLSIRYFLPLLFCCHNPWRLASGLGR